MKIPKCLKSVTGKHSWKKEKFGVINLEQTKNGRYRQIYGTYAIQPYCRYCGMVDDRKVK